MAMIPNGEKVGGAFSASRIVGSGDVTPVAKSGQSGYVGASG